jgi:hypothetical protein
MAAVQPNFSPLARGGNGGPDRQGRIAERVGQMSLSPEPVS